MNMIRTAYKVFKVIKYFTDVLYIVPMLHDSLLFTGLVNMNFHCVLIGYPSRKPNVLSISVLINNSTHGATAY